MGAARVALPGVPALAEHPRLAGVVAQDAVAGARQQGLGRGALPSGRVSLAGASPGRVAGHQTPFDTQDQRSAQSRKTKRSQAPRKQDSPY
jgi:hypothetical protein